jgi:hypothetical protein
MMATTGTAPANDDFHKLLLVVKDLAQRLDENRQATTKLKLHADLLKVPARPHRANNRNTCERASRLNLMGFPTRRRTVSSQVSVPN